jgi:hypothetical protein
LKQAPGAKGEQAENLALGAWRGMRVRFIDFFVKRAIIGLIRTNVHFAEWFG